VRLQLASLLPEARPTGEGEGTLELASSWVDAPKLVSATVLEGSGPLRARRVFDALVPGFRGFLDGTQRSVVASHLRGVPIVYGTVAAVVRERRNRRMHTWNLPLVETRIYAPRSMLAGQEWETLKTMYRHVLADTSDGESVSQGHPLALRDQAIHRVQAHREALETRLAERWCASENDRLFIDGGISGSESVARIAVVSVRMKSILVTAARGPMISTRSGSMRTLGCRMLSGPTMRIPERTGTRRVIVWTNSRRTDFGVISVTRASPLSH
jgi:hypothetical protein